MKLGLLLASSANAATLFSGVYNSIAQQMINQASGYLDTMKTLTTPIDIAGNANLLNAIDAFDTAITDMDTQVLVDIISSLDVNLLIDADGNFNADALVTVFQGLDPTMLQNLQTEFTNAIPAETMTTINNSMSAFLDLGDVFQSIMNNEIELSNFAALYNDFADAVTGLDSAFDNQILGGSTAMLLTYSSLITTVTEKALVVWESIGDIEFSFRSANVLVNLGIEDRLNDIGHNDGESYLCTAGNNGFFNTVQEAVDFIPDVMVTNFRPPITSAMNLYNDFIHGINVGGIDFSMYKVTDTYLNEMFDTIDNVAGSVSGTITEVKTLALPFQAQINGAVTGTFC
jgi:hypothetical protein